MWFEWLSLLGCLIIIIFWYGSVAKHLESANTMFSFIWWIIGFYWVSSAGEALADAAPKLYWYFSRHNFLQLWSHLAVVYILQALMQRCFHRLTITFLAFDVFFVVICVTVACIIGIAVCCCLPCIIALLYAVADQVSCCFSYVVSSSIH